MSGPSSWTLDGAPLLRSMSQSSQAPYIQMVKRLTLRDVSEPAPSDDEKADVETRVATQEGVNVGKATSGEDHPLDEMVL
jgi:hypothetical protein